MVKWPFKGLSNLQLGAKKVTLNHLEQVYFRGTMIQFGCCFGPFNTFPQKVGEKPWNAENTVSCERWENEEIVFNLNMYRGHYMKPTQTLHKNKGKSLKFSIHFASNLIWPKMDHLVIPCIHPIWPNDNIYFTNRDLPEIRGPISLPTSYILGANRSVREVANIHVFPERIGSRPT